MARASGGGRFGEPYFHAASGLAPVGGCVHPISQILIFGSQATEKKKKATDSYIKLWFTCAGYRADLFSHQDQMVPTHRGLAQKQTSMSADIWRQQLPPSALLKDNQ